MTATADTRALLAACRAAPQDTHAVLLLADAIFEAGRERDACYLRCTADPDNDAHRHALASLWERGDPERAEFVRLQIETHGVPLSKNQDMSYREWKGLNDRAESLHVAHSDRWRRGPACEKCGGKRQIYTGMDGMKWIPCPSCHGTGDIGGLMRTQLLGHWLAGTDTQFSDSGQPYLHRVEHVRGTMRVHCTLAEAWADGKPTDWIRAVCRYHPVSEVLLTEREPGTLENGRRVWWGEDEHKDSIPSHLPILLFKLLAGGIAYVPSQWTNPTGPSRLVAVSYPTPELARLALARAVALAVRLDLEDRP